MSSGTQEFWPASGWVVVTGIHKRTGRRYTHVDTMRHRRRDAVEAYLDGASFTWAEARRRYGSTVVRCTLTPAGAP